MSTTDVTTFFSFIKEHEIQIPLIQRDYVQGLAPDNKTQEKRDDFVTKLLNALLPDGTTYNLDFIYGARETFGVDTNQNNQGAFLPLDGQQRLTTLYLLHWCLLQMSQPHDEAASDEEKNVFESRRQMLSRFSYKTRISSKRFCEKLISTNFKNTELVDQIKAKYWYDNDVKADPTVRSMIDMLTLIEKMLVEKPYCEHLHDMATNLFEQDRVTFSLLDMQQYNLTDGLYVKMNARGKELTPFENWKAEFIALISDHSEDKKRFTKGIEHEWNDVFWTICYKKYLDRLEHSDDKEIEYPRIDESFMNFFDNFCRLFYFIYTDKSDLKAEDYRQGLWSTVKEVFCANATRAKLFDILDTLSEIKKQGGIEKFFEGIFYVDSSSDWSTQTTKVKIFGDKTNLFDAVCSSSEFEWSHVMLYAILTYCTKHKVFSVNDDLRNYVRVCRNYLDEHNYFNTSNVTITPQIRANDMKKYNADFTMLQKHPKVFASLESADVTNEYIESERKKLKYYQDCYAIKLVRKIEDMTYTHGNLKAFSVWLDNCIGDSERCKKTWEAIYAFRKAKPLQKVQLFCIFGYRGIEVKDCAHGKAIFLGGEFDGTSRWMVHFRQKSTTPDNKHPLEDWFCAYMEEYVKNGDLDNIIKSHTDKAVVSPSKPVDYMLKYPDVLASQVYWRKEPNSAPFYFAMQNPWNDLDMITIHSFSRSPLNKAYQTCPMVNAVARGMKDFEKYASCNPSRMSSISEAATKASLVINKDGDWNNLLFYLHFRQHEWITNEESFNSLPSDLKGQFIHDPETNYYKLNVQDWIADTIDFMDKVVSEFESSKVL